MGTHVVSGTATGAGAALLSRRQVVVKRLDAIQNFGTMDILCARVCAIEQTAARRATHTRA